MSTLMIHDATTELYENLHDEEGNPKVLPEDVTDICKTYKSNILHEIQMIVDICLEYNEGSGK